MADLFDHAVKERIASEAPLAARMRPRTLDEFVGQEDIVGPGRLLRRAIEADRLFSSILLWGPPGTGKTTLAMIIAHRTRSAFETISAVMAGVADIRRVIADAQERRRLYGQRTILLVDEIHRFNKAQQDASCRTSRTARSFIGATTENPYFEVIGALVSRSRVSIATACRRGVRTAAAPGAGRQERGYGLRNVALDDDATEHLIHVAGGDARNALNALELAVESTPPGTKGAIHVTLDVAQESIQRRAVLYDKDGDAHYDTISAFIKSVRGSDPDAALYWLAKMLYAGEDPRFILRRRVIWRARTSLADLNGLVVASAAIQAFDHRLPEGVIRSSRRRCTGDRPNPTAPARASRVTGEDEGAGAAAFQDAIATGARWARQLYLPTSSRAFYAAELLAGRHQGYVVLLPGDQGTRRRQPSGQGWRAAQPGASASSRRKGRVTREQKRQRR
jgi:putative ATPase